MKLYNNQENGYDQQYVPEPSFPPSRRLYDRGNTVVGLEGVEKPVEEFFESRPDLKHTVEDLSFGKLYKVCQLLLQVRQLAGTVLPSL